jgi:hypothetical protein
MRDRYIIMLIAVFMGRECNRTCGIERRVFDQRDELRV